MRSLILLFLSVLCLQAKAQHWTYFVSLPGSGNNVGKYYLWVPPQATSIKGLILASEARLSQIAGDTLIRQACAEASLGILGFKGTNFVSGFSLADSVQLLAALAQLAEKSRFAEIAHCPWIPYGTSVGGIFAWQLANLMPHRVAGVIEDNAIFTSQTSGRPRPYDIPLLVSRGANEQVQDKWFQSRDSVLSFRRRGGSAALLIQAGCGHFSWTKFESTYMALWLKKLAAARISEIALTGPISLTPVVESMGWLSDSSFYASDIEVAPFQTYSGNKELAFWHFDQELANLWKTLHQGQFARQPQTVITATYPENACPNFQAFQTCDNNVVLGLPGNVFNLNASATSGLPVRFGTYNGGFQLQNNEIKATSGALETNGATGWAIAIQEGNESFQCFERALRFQVRPKSSGTPQTVTFTPLADQVFTASPFANQVSLSSGLTPEVFVETGSVSYNNGTFTILPFPRGTSTVIVRYGHSGNASHATATSQIDTFLINRTDSVTYNWTKKDSSSWLNLHPNPTHDGLFIAVPTGEQAKRIRIANLQGQVKKQLFTFFSGQVFMDVKDLPSGAYLLELETEKRKHVTRFTKVAR